MDKVEVRLKCLEIAIVRAVHHETAISMAKEFEKFVYDQQEVNKAHTPQAPLKKEPEHKRFDTPKILP